MNGLTFVCALLLASASAAAAQSPAVPVTVNNFIRAETHHYFSNAHRDAGGLAKYSHHRDLMPVDRQTVIRPNRDTYYSPAVVDLDAGPVTVTLPDSKGRYRAMQVLNEDQYVVGPVVYDAGTYTFDRKSVGTRYALIAVRTLGDPNDANDVRAVHALQDATGLNQSGTGVYQVPAWDDEGRQRLRAALLTLSSTLPNFNRSFGQAGQVDPVMRLLGSAAAWGGNPDRDALYLNITPAKNDGATVYKVTVKDVPVDAFWSISVYNSEGFFQKNDFNAYSLNNMTAKKGADGSVDVQFGACDGKIPNCLPTMPGWNYMVRLYRPRAELLDGSWRFPEAKPVG